MLPFPACYYCRIMPSPNDPSGVVAAPTNQPTKWCAGCQYALDGLGQPKCPECGRAFVVDDPTTYLTSLDNQRRPALWRGTLAIASLPALPIIFLAMFDSFSPWQAITRFPRSDNSFIMMTIGIPYFIGPILLYRHWRDFFSPNVNRAEAIISYVAAILGLMASVVLILAIANRAYHRAYDLNEYAPVLIWCLSPCALPLIAIGFLRKIPHGLNSRIALLTMFLPNALGCIVVAFTELSSKPSTYIACWLVVVYTLDLIFSIHERWRIRLRTT